MHDAKALRVEAADDTMLAAYLIDPGRAEYDLDDLAAENGARARAGAARRGGDGRARPPRRGGAPARRPLARERVASAGSSGSTTRSSCRSPACSRRWRTRASASTRTGWARSPPGSRDRIEELEARAYELAGEEFVLGSPQQLGRILFEKLELTPGPQGQDRLLDRREGAARDPRATTRSSR